MLGVDPDGILIGNGSDDILTILTRAFVPEGGLVVSPTPSYLLYRTLAEIQGARFQTVPFTADWDLPEPWPVAQAHLTFLANPNSPSGNDGRSTAAGTAGRRVERPAGRRRGLRRFRRGQRSGTAEPAAAPGVIVTRTLSKSYALAGIRFGFAVADPALVRELVKVKDSYNCDVLSLAAATAALEDQDYFRAMRAKILATRGRMAEGAGAARLRRAAEPGELRLVPPRRPAGEADLRGAETRGILVRYMNYEGYGDGLRITVGTDAEIDRLLEELTGLV